MRQSDSPPAPEAPVSAHPATPPPLGARTAMAWAGALILLTTAYIDNHHPRDNVNSQFALTCALVERGTFAIDAYHETAQFLTSDKAFYNGHFYCDKSPVNALLGVPAFAACRALGRLRGGAPDYDAARYGTTVLTSGVAAAVLAMLLAAALMRRGAAPAPAAKAAALWIAATPLLGYAVLYQGYLPACVMCLGGYLLAAKFFVDPAGTGPARLFGAGLLLGLAAWTQNTFALAALAAGGALLARALAAPAEGGRRGRGIARRAWPWVLGGLAGGAGYFIYSWSLFGSCASPYAYEAVPFFREHMARGLMGAGWPSGRIAWYLTFHEFQGLFRWFPLTALALLGALWQLAAGRRGAAGRLESAVALAVFTALLLYCSGYFMWWGGYSYAPRHLIPALPLLALGLGPWLTARRHRLDRLLFAVGLASALVNGVAVAVDPQPPQPRPDAMMLAHPEEVPQWPSPFMTLQTRFWLEGEVDQNWGTHCGLRGRCSLLPLAALWVGAWVWLDRKRPGVPVNKSKKTEDKG